LFEPVSFQPLALSDLKSVILTSGGQSVTSEANNDGHEDLTQKISCEAKAMAALRRKNMVKSNDMTRTKPALEKN